MERLEQTAGLDRALEALPTAKVLQERHAAGQGLTSPELAVLLAYTKLELQRALVASDVPDDPYLDAELVAYFPPSLRTGFDDALGVAPAAPRDRGHRRRQRGGEPGRDQLPLPAVRRDRPLAPGARTRAHVIARDVFDAADTWAAIDALDLVVPAAVQDEMFLLVRRLVERSARWLVRHVEPLDLGPTVERFRPGVRDGRRGRCPSCWSGAVADAAAATDGPVHRRGRRRRPGPPGGGRATRRWSRCPAVALAVEHDVDARDGGARSSSCSTTASASIASATASPRCPRADRWQTEARAALRDDFYESQHALDRGGADRDRRDRHARGARRRLVGGARRRRSAATASSSPTSSAPTPPTSPPSPSSAARSATSQRSTDAPTRRKR